LVMKPVTQSLKFIVKRYYDSKNENGISALQSHHAPPQRAGRSAESQTHNRYHQADLLVQEIPEDRREFLMSRTVLKLVVRYVGPQEPIAMCTGVILQVVPSYAISTDVRERQLRNLATISLSFAA